MPAAGSMPTTASAQVLRFSSAGGGGVGSRASAVAELVAGSDPGRRAEGVGDRLGQSLDDWLAFSRATDLLVGLTGTTRERARQALLDVATDLGVDPPVIAARFGRALTADDDQAEGLLIRLTEVALLSRQDGVTRHPVGLPWDAGTVSPPALDVQITGAGRVPWVVVRGDLDLDTAPLLNAAVSAAARRMHCPPAEADELDLDLRGVTFLTNAGLDALNELRDTVTGRGARLRVVAPIAWGPRRLLELGVAKGWIAPEFAVDVPVSGSDGRP